MSLVRHIQEQITTFRPAERKVADVVRAQPERIVQLSISELARQAGVSDPTVVRFCRSVGCAGFQDFKVRLAGDLGKFGPTAAAAFADCGVTPTDSPRTIGRKVVAAAAQSLAALERQLDAAQLGRAIDLLLVARRIDFYGCGASAIVAADAHHKFFRMNIPTHAYADSHMQVMSAATLSAGDAVVAISNTGRSRELSEAVRIARGFGATVIALTASGSPLAGQVDIPICIDLPEDTGFVTPMTSRLAHLVVIDMLAVAVAARRPNASGRLADIKQALRGLKLPESGLLNSGSGDQADVA